MTRKEKTGLGDYADSNSKEYFAQATGAYFGNAFPVEADKNLSKTDPDMYYWMSQVYGPPRKLAP